MDLTSGENPLAGGGGFVVELDRFHGPLHLLLHLIRQQDIDIFDIPIARITAQFLAAIRKIRAEELDSAGEFLEMAATLVRIKLQMLLPRPEEEEEEDPRAELVRRLLEYEQIREISALLAQAETDRSRRFGKGHVPPRPAAPAEETPLETTWEELWEAALQVALPERREITHQVARRAVAMDEKIDLILETLRGRGRVEFRELVAPWKERLHGVMTFLAGLELARRHLLRLRQVRPFAELWLYPRSDGERRRSAPDAEPGTQDATKGEVDA